MLPDLGANDSAVPCEGCSSDLELIRSIRPRHPPCIAPLLWGRDYTKWNGHMIGIYKVENQHVLVIKSQTNGV